VAALRAGRVPGLTAAASADPGADRRPVVAVLSGANVDTGVLARLLAAEA
jgi:hypothetical protein